MIFFIMYKKINKEIISYGIEIKECNFHCHKNIYILGQENIDKILISGKNIMENIMILEIKSVIVW